MKEDLRQIQQGPNQKTFIEHQIALYDTLEGISLSYGVSVADIKRWNRLQSESILHLKSLKIAVKSIPEESMRMSEIDLAREERERKIQTLDILTNEFGTKIPRSVIEKALLKNDYDFERARKYIQEKLEWQQKARHFAVEEGVSEVHAYNLLIQTKWNYEMARKLLRDGSLYLSLESSDTSKPKVD